MNASIKCFPPAQRLAIGCILAISQSVCVAQVAMDMKCAVKGSGDDAENAITAWGRGTCLVPVPARKDFDEVVSRQSEYSASLEKVRADLAEQQKLLDDAVKAFVEEHKRQAGVIDKLNKEVGRLKQALDQRGVLRPAAMPAPPR